MQDAIGLTRRLFAENGQEGEVPDDALLGHAPACAPSTNRRLAAAGGRKKRNVFDSRNGPEGKVAVVELEAAESDLAEAVGIACAAGREQMRVLRE